MKTTLIFAAIVGIVTSRPQNPRNAYIIRNDYNAGGFGGFSFNVETSDGFRHHQTGELRNVGSKGEALVVKGSYSYIGPDGITYTVIYVADENGFQPAGYHLPPAAHVKKLGAPPTPAPSVPGAPRAQQGILTTPLNTLIGGNNFGK